MADLNIGVGTRPTELNFDLGVGTVMGVGVEYTAGEGIWIEDRVINADVTQEELDGKAAVGHKHVIADVDGLQAALDIVAANAAAHNAIYRGKDITSMETSGELYVNIANGTFGDIYIGDYFTKSINGTDYVLRIAALDYYYGFGDTAFNTHHAVIVPDATFGKAQMNSSNVVTGGYIGTKMRTETLQTWLSYLKTAFGSHLLTPRCLYDNKCDGSAYSGAAWYDGPLELMTEEQVYGARQQGITNHYGWNYPGVDYAQFPLFALDHSRICNRSAWWLRSVSGAAAFCRVNDNGKADCNGASDSFGVRPRFLIG